MMQAHENSSGETGQVEEVRKQWLVHEDGAMAHHMQQDEFAYKYGLNRYNRRTVREDIPVAKDVQSEEEERLQKERMKQLKELQQREKEDALVAERMMNEAMIEEERARVARELHDERLALKLQEQEKDKYEHKQRERILQKERKKLERQLQEARSDTGLENNLNAAIQDMHLADGHEKVVREDGRMEDTGDFSDFYLQPSQAMGNDQQKELQEMQDEELARLLQDQEHKRGGQIKRDKLKALEEQDAELAKVMQQQEQLRLEAKKRRQQQKKQSQSLPPASVMAGVAPHQIARQTSQPPPFRQPPDYHQRQLSGGRAQNSHPALGGVDVSGAGGGPMYMNQEDEVRQMRRARDSPPPLPPGHPVMELYNPPSPTGPAASHPPNTNMPAPQPPPSAHVDASPNNNRTTGSQGQYQQNAFASIDPTVSGETLEPPARTQPTTDNTNNPPSRYEMGMIAAMRSIDDDDSNAAGGAQPGNDAQPGQRRPSGGQGRSPPVGSTATNGHHSHKDKSKKQSKSNCKQQ